MRRLTILGGLVAALTLASPAVAHNAGHLIVDGQCIVVGSEKEAPLVGEGAPQNVLRQLDLIPATSPTDLSDQYGARWAAIKGNSRVLPGGC